LITERRRTAAKRAQPPRGDTEDDSSDLTDLEDEGDPDYQGKARYSAGYGQQTQSSTRGGKLIR